VLHDNRTRLRPICAISCSRQTYGYRAPARAVCDIDRYWLFVMLLPISPVAKLAKIAVRMLDASRVISRSLAEFPVFRGLCAYGAGLGAGGIDARPVCRRESESYDAAPGGS